MELTNDFLVPLPVARAWTVLNDVERVARCLPGVALDAVTGDECRGTVRIKIGPVTTDYAGTASFVWRDEVAGRVVVETEASEVDGPGWAKGTIHFTVAAVPGGTRVWIVSNLTLSGRVERFGRSVLNDVADRLVEDFVAELHRTVLVDEEVLVGAPAEAAATADAGGAPEEKRGRLGRRRLVAAGRADAQEGEREGWLSGAFTSGGAPGADVDAPAARASEPGPVLPEPEPSPVVPEPEPAPVVPEPEPAPVVPEPEPTPEPPAPPPAEPPAPPPAEPDPAPILPEPDPAPILPEPDPGPILPGPTAAAPEPEVVVDAPVAAVPDREPDTPPEPELVGEAERAAEAGEAAAHVDPAPDAPIVRPPTTPSTTAPALTPPIDVRPSRASGAGSEALAQRAVPVVAIFALLWLLRRLFGSSDRS